MVIDLFLAKEFPLWKGMEVPGAFSTFFFFLNPGLRWNVLMSKRNTDLQTTTFTLTTTSHHATG